MIRGEQIRSWLKYEVGFRYTFNPARLSWIPGLRSRPSLYPSPISPSLSFFEDFFERERERERELGKREGTWRGIGSIGQVGTGK
jgi:hypothetical protein